MHEDCVVIGRRMSKSLETLCPATTSLWKAEAVLDQAYRWTGDRVLCRTVPAGWTASKDKEEVDAVIAAKSMRCFRPRNTTS